MQNNTLGVCAFFALLSHIIVVLGISFKLPEFKALQNMDNALDVILINTTDPKKNDNATAISTSNNVGGGNHHDHASAPLMYKPTNNNPVTTIQHIASTKSNTQEKDNLLSSQKSNTLITKMRLQKERNTLNEQINGSEKLTVKNKKKQERERLIAKIKAEYQAYHKKPKKKFLEPNTKEHHAASYLQKWRQKVESIGNASYPIQAKQNNLSGHLTLTAEIKQDGSIHKVYIHRKSRYQIFNTMAKKFITDAAPFAVFSDEMKKEADILVITRVFRFHANSLSTSHNHIGTP